MAERMMNRGFYSVLRWASDSTRDEARNLAVLLVDAEGQFGGLRSAPPSAISANLRQQGLLDSIVEGLRIQFDTDDKPDLSKLREWQKGLNRSLYLTEPRPVAVSDTGATLQALYKSFIAPRGAPRSPTKGAVLDQVVTALRRSGYKAERSKYVGDFLFDAVVNPDNGATAIEVLSFATATRDWATAERDAGHFVYAVEQTHLPAIAIVKGPTENSRETAGRSQERVLRWFHKADIPSIDSEHMDKLETTIERLHTH